MTVDRVFEALRRVPEPWDEDEVEKAMWRVIWPRVAIALVVYVVWSLTVPVLLGATDRLAVTAILYAGKATAIGVGGWPVLRVLRMSEREMDRRLRAVRVRAEDRRAELRRGAAERGGRRGGTAR